MTIGTVYHSSKTIKRQSSSKNDHWCTNRHMSTQSPPNTRKRRAATLRDLHHMCLGSGHSPSPVGYVSTWTSMRLAPVLCRVLLHSLLPTDDACSSSSLSTTVIKFSIDIIMKAILFVILNVSVCFPRGSVGVEILIPGGFGGLNEKNFQARYRSP